MRTGLPDATSEKNQDLLNIQKILASYDYIPKERLGYYIKLYFNQKFDTNEASIDIQSKKAGDQLGATVIVNNGENKFYVKTHAMGHKSQHSSGAQPVDLKELFI